MGGYIAREIARIAPHRVARLALIATSSRGDSKLQERRKAEAVELADYLQQLYSAAILRWLPTDENSPKTQLHRMVNFFVSATKHQRKTGIKLTS